MRLCAVKDIEEGMILGKSIYEINGKLLLGAGYRITQEIKKRLLSKNYSLVYIMEEGAEDVVPEDIISDEIALQAKEKLADKVNELEKQTKFKNIGMSKAKDLIKKGYLKDVDITYDMHSVIDEILKDISATGATFMNMVMIKSEDTYFLDHALNTTVLSILIGKKYRYTNEELRNLALGTFLHDIGKVILDQTKGKKTDRISELYQEHPTFGYLILSNSASSVSAIEKQIVNQHHEYQDGSGFPIGLTGLNKQPIKLNAHDGEKHIYRMAEICCVANALDNRVFNPLKKIQLSQADALKQIINNSGKIYNKNIVQTLLKVVPYYPIGTYVRVVNIVDPHLIGYMGVVAKVNEKNLNKPVIILTKDKFLKKIKPIIIETSKLNIVELEVII